MDALLTLVAAVFNYAGPFFLKRILDAIVDPNNRQARARAYVYALLTFLASLVKVSPPSPRSFSPTHTHTHTHAPDPSGHAPPVVWTPSCHENKVPLDGRCLRQGAQT
jgi:hypothetical protein